jgi:hypothetical protein
MKTLKQIEWGQFTFVLVMMTIAGGVTLDFIFELFGADLTPLNLWFIFLGVLTGSIISEINTIRNKEPLTEEEKKYLEATWNMTITDDKVPTFGEYLKSEGNKR